MDKKTLLILCVFLQAISAGSYAQNLLNNPESVVFDSVRNRYLVSNWGDGTIVQIDSNGNQSYFSTALQNQYQLAALYLYGDTLLAAAGNAPNAGIVGFDLATAAMIFHIPIPGIGLPNDITSDTAGILYVTDYWSSGLYKITNRTPSLYVGSSLVNPNGMTYDQPNHRLLILSVLSAGTPIMAVDLQDSSLSMVIYSNLYALDGITFDRDRYVYVSSWATDAIHRYDETFSAPPELFSSGHLDPADIYYDRVNDLLVVPNFTSNSIDFVPIPPSSIENPQNCGIPDKYLVFQNYPNPFNAQTTISYMLPRQTNVKIDIVNALGRRIETLVNENQTAGLHQIIWNREEASSGIYLYTIQAGNLSDTKIMVLIK